MACESETKHAHALEAALASPHLDIRKVLDSVEQYEVQIRYTQIDRYGDSLVLKDYDFQVDDSKYFYPASTVKFPAAVLALEKLSSIDSLSRDSKYYVEGDSIENSFAEDISKIFSVSDNHANNRLVEFLGQDAMNSRLNALGIAPIRIAHRLGVHDNDITTKPLIIYLNDSTTTTTEAIINTSPSELHLTGIQKGIGFYAQDSLFMESFDFSLKNYYPIKAQHALLKRIIFPDLFETEQQFKLSEDQHNFLLDAMNRLPKSVGYDPIEYYDGYCKFFMFGDSKEEIPEHIKIYNKVGFAYGTLTDCAYITDTKNNVEFMLTATLLVNKDGIFNDDAYEYDVVGLPFLAELGRQIYTYEVNRKN